MFTAFEIIDILIMTLVLGFIFKDFFRPHVRVSKSFDPIEYYKSKTKTFFDWQNMKFAIIVTAPAIILHEFGHKFVAILFGATATFHAAYMWVGLGIVLKLIGSSFIFFVPAYVAHTAVSTPLQSAGIAFAGPAVNLILWISAWALLKTSKFSQRNTSILHLTSRINMFLFFFNMIPLGFFDGSHVAKGLLAHFGF